MTTLVAPCDAESIQTACRRAQGGTLSIEASDVCDVVATIHLFESDAFLLIADDASAARVVADDEPSAVLEVLDYAPLALRERVRALIWLTGTLHEIPDDLQRDLAVEIACDHVDERLLDVGHGHRLLRMEIDTAVLASPHGAGAVRVDDLACAHPDPFWAYEKDWLTHLESAHADLVHQLAKLIPAARRGGRVRPLSLDRFGITFRIENDDSDDDVRLPFARPVERMTELSAALHSLALDPEFDHRI